VNKRALATARRMEADGLELLAKAKRLEADALEADEDRGASEAPVYFTVEQAAKEFDVSRRTIFEWIALGMPSLKRGRVRRIPVAAATSWLGARERH
jgi:excisionase family DNA binding protein